MSQKNSIGHWFLQTFFHGKVFDYYLIVFFYFKYVHYKKILTNITKLKEKQFHCGTNFLNTLYLFSKSNCLKQADLLFNEKQNLPLMADVILSSIDTSGKLIGKVYECFLIKGTLVPN